MAGITRHPAGDDLVEPIVGSPGRATARCGSVTE